MNRAHQKTIGPEERPNQSKPQPNASMTTTPILRVHVSASTHQETEDPRIDRSQERSLLKPAVYFTNILTQQIGLREPNSMRNLSCMPLLVPLTPLVSRTTQPKIYRTYIMIGAAANVKPDQLSYFLDPMQSPPTRPIHDKCDPCLVQPLNGARTHTTKYSERHDEWKAHLTPKQQCITHFCHARLHTQHYFLTVVLCAQLRGFKVKTRESGQCETWRVRQGRRVTVEKTPPLY